MNLYISDTHFGHSNVINFDNRPFLDRDEMDRAMIYRWNNRVSEDDDVWFLGDFCYRSERDPVWYLRQLKGRKHLIIGNHDKVTVESVQAAKYFESVDKTNFTTDILEGETIQVVMSHFPIADWNGMHHGTYHVYGHIHNRREDTYYFMKTRERAFNAGCMINNYAPASIRELRENNKRFHAMEQGEYCECTRCPYCGSFGLEMDLQDVESYFCRTCGAHFSVSYRGCI